MKVEKIDGIIIKYAFHKRTFMLEMVNKGVRAEFFPEPVSSLFKSLYDLFIDPTVATVPTHEAFVRYLRSVGKSETANYAETFLKRLEKIEIVDGDFPVYLKEFRNRYSKYVASTHFEKIKDQIENDGIENVDFSLMYEKAFKELTKLNGIEVFDEGTVADDIAAMKAEYEAVEGGNLQDFRGVTVGIPTLDNETNGFQPAELIIVAGMEGTGKSLLMMNMGIQAWLGTNKVGREILPTGKNILYFTLEMPRSNRGKNGMAAYLNKRILSCLSELPFKEIRNGKLNEENRAKLMKTYEFVLEYKKHYNFTVVDIPRGAKVEDIEIKYQEWKERLGSIDLVIVDYMGIMAPSTLGGKSGSADWEAQGSISADLHKFARVYGVPVLTGAQVNRPGGKNHSLNDQSYNTTRISRSSQITQNANIVLQIGCRDDEQKHPDMPIYITKMRDGGKEPFSLTKAFDKMRVYDGMPQGVMSGLDSFEDALTKGAPLGNLEIIEDEDTTPSDSPVLDFGDGESDLDDMDFSEADF